MNINIVVFITLADDNIYMERKLYLCRFYCPLCNGQFGRLWFNEYS